MPERGPSLSAAYPDSVRFLYSLGNEFKTLKLGLDRVQTVFEALGNPQDSYRNVHVAGTNGKGSTCALMESALRGASYRTGLCTSPHLVEPTERIRIDGVPVSAEEFASAFDAVHRVSVELMAKGELEQHPTYFESITAMAFWLFRERQIDFAVVETGMGGRLDATNVVQPELAVITPIDFDHEKYLGDTIPKIAFEKAGIIKPGRPVVTAHQRPEALEVIKARAEELNSPLDDLSGWQIEGLEVTEYGSHFRIVPPHYLQRHPIQIHCPLIGSHQVENVLTAVAALSYLGLDDNQIAAGVEGARWPGRLERIQCNPDLFLDGAHNPAGASALAAYIQQFHQGRRLWMVFAAMQDKDVHQIGRILFPLATDLIFTAPQGQPRAYRGEELRQLAQRPDAVAADTPRDALRLVAQAAPDDVVFVTGSLYLVGEVRGLLTESL